MKFRPSKPLCADYNYNAAMQTGNTPLATQHLEQAGFFRSEMDKSASTVLRSLIFDTINPQLDSIRIWSLNLETPASSYITILDDLNFGELALAQSAYNAIPSRFTLSAEQVLDYTQFGDILSILSAQSMDTLDSTAIQTVLSIAQQPKGFSAQTAKSILGLNGFSFDSPECSLPTCCEFQRAGTERGVNQYSLISDLALQVFPNPAQETVNFYLDTPLSTPANIKVLDISGNLVWTQEFLSKTIWNVVDVPAGLYFYTLSTAAGRPISGKISVIH